MLEKIRSLDKVMVRLTKPTSREDFHWFAARDTDKALRAKFVESAIQDLFLSSKIPATKQPKRRRKFS